MLALPFWLGCFRLAPTRGSEEVLAAEESAISAAGAPGLGPAAAGRAPARGVLLGEALGSLGRDPVAEPRLLSVGPALAGSPPGLEVALTMLDQDLAAGAELLPGSPA